MNVTDWPSLGGQLTLAEHLYDDKSTRLKRWLDMQAGRIDDPAFAKLFADHINLPGIVASDYNHRHVRTQAGSLLGGIRFFGQDVERPFVEVIGHDFALGDIPALLDVVASEWSAFAPRHLRLLTTPQDWDRIVLARSGATLDMTVHAARYGDIARSDRRVALKPFADVEQAIEMVALRYAELSREQPDLARNIQASEADDLRDWHRRGHLRAVCAESGPVGLFAAAPGAVEWIEGDEVYEEVIMSTHAGRGYAASAQAVWAAAAPDLTTLMVGTIDRHNHASRHTAKRVGRDAVLAYGFVPIG